MDTDHAGVRFFYLLLDLLLLNIAVFLVLEFGNSHGYIDASNKEIFYLHANISEMIAYMLYSKRNFFYTDKFVERLKLRSKRFLGFVVSLFILGLLILPKGYPKSIIIEYVFIFYFLKMLTFYFVYRTHKKRYEKENYGYRVAIIGTSKSSQILGNLLKNNPRLGFKFIGYICDNENDKENHKLTLGNINDIDDLIDKNRINMLFVTNPKYFTEKKTKKLLTICNKNGLRLRYILMNGYWNNAASSQNGSGSYFEMFNPQEIPLDHISLRIQKRIFDIIFSLSVIIFIFSWLFPIVALIIKLTSRGPVFFVQDRTGINNKTFKCYKFRTMTVNKESDTKQAVKNDARVTPFGSFMRKTSIDELPQFFNVLKGDMSVVGPRPHMLKHTTQYSSLIKHYKVRHFVKPGITGWAQVNGFRGLTDELWKMERRVEHDMQYLEKWSLILDLRIIFMTVAGKETFQNAF